MCEMVEAERSTTALVKGLRADLAVEKQHHEEEVGGSPAAQVPGSGSSGATCHAKFIIRHQPSSGPAISQMSS
jgi:hypothetical protein